MRYPAHCPVFEVDGRDYEARPWFDWPDVIGDLCIVGDDGEPLKTIGKFTAARPVTKAAREMLKWSRQ